MVRANVRWWFLPYCIDKIGEKYVILNRAYKPIGVVTDEWVDHEPYAQPIDGLTKAKAAKISYKSDGNFERIYLYNDGCVPTHSKKDWDAYSKRLAVLAGLEVDLTNGE